MLFEGTPNGGAARMSEHARTIKKAKVRPDLTTENSEADFTSSGAAEKSVEGAALKTRTGARLIAAVPHPCPANVAALLIIEPHSFR
jgi:hypothetical protein